MVQIARLLQIYRISTRRGLTALVGMRIIVFYHSDLQVQGPNLRLIYASDKRGTSKAIDLVLKSL